MRFPDWETFKTYLLDIRHVKPSDFHEASYSYIVEYFKDREMDVDNIGAFFAYIRVHNKKNVTLANSTLNCHLKVLRHIGRKLGEPYKTLTREFLPFPEEEPEIIPLTEDEEKAIIEAGYAYDFEVGLMIDLLAKTAGRATEIANLTWDDIQGEEIVFKNTKNRKDHRLPLYNDMVEKIDKLRLLKGNEKYLFGSEGKPIYNQKMNRRVKTVGKLAGIKKDVHCHIFRHTFASLSAEDEVSLPELQKYMNHKDIKSTLKYIHVSMGGKKKVARRFHLNKLHMTELDAEKRKNEFEESFIGTPFRAKVILERV